MRQLFEINCARFGQKINFRPESLVPSRRRYFTMQPNEVAPKSFVYNNIEYNNVVIDLKKASGIGYTFRSKQFPSFKNRVLRTPLDINKATLASQRVRDAIQRKVEDKTLSQATAEREAERILDVMSHKFDMKAVRTLVYPSKKILQWLYPSGIFVNEQAIKLIKANCVQNPVVFAPSHRTYMDFILLQFLCYHYELPLPAIASAQDFLQMHFMSEMLRRCGAYFIRRSFNDDELYKAIFTKYVQNQLINGDSTMEAFVEGTRSRTGKSLYPKYGFLSTILEPFLADRVFDVTIVPVNITYNRLLEENLYAYEMLGFSKPPESTGALFKAYSIMGTNYGRIYVTFGEPISVRDFVNSFPAHIDRSTHVVPSSDYFTMTDGEQRAIRCLAHKIIKRQEKCAVVDVWPLACLEIQRQLAYTPALQNDEMPEIDFYHLTINVNKLVSLARRLGHSISTTRCMIDSNNLTQKITKTSTTGSPHSAADYDSLSATLKQQFEIHENFITYQPERSMLIIHRPPVNSSSSTITYFEHQSNNIFNSSQNRKHVELIVPRLLLTHYANQCLHLFMPICYLAASFRVQNRPVHALPIEILKRNFQFLQRLLAREFVYDLLGEDHGNFEMALQAAVNAGIFRMTNGKDESLLSATTADKNAENSAHLLVEMNNADDILSLKHMLEPFLVNYYICIDFFSQYEREILERDFVQLVQEGALSRLVSNGDDNSEISNNETKTAAKPSANIQASPKWFQILSTDTTKNCLNSLLDQGAVSKVKGSADFEKHTTSVHGPVVSTSVKNQQRQTFFVGYGNKKLADVKKTLNELLSANFYEATQTTGFSAEELSTVRKEQKKQDIKEKDDVAEGKIRIRSKL